MNNSITSPFQKSQSARACEAAKKGAIDCFDKIKSKCKKSFNSKVGGALSYPKNFVVA